MTEETAGEGTGEPRDGPTPWGEPATPPEAAPPPPEPSAPEPPPPAVAGPDAPADGVAPAPAAAPTAPPPPRPPWPARREGVRSTLEAFRDNAEALAFALVLALLLRHFAIEVFKIPTASMEPTLFGDNSPVHPNTPGDRILVDKAAYLFQDPQRWDVLVFHYPLDWGRNFIKRAVGLPGEALRIERGDPWVGPWTQDGPPLLHPARKPRRVREQLYVPLYPPVGPRTGGAPADWWRETTEGSPRFRLESLDRFVCEGEPATAASPDAPLARVEYAFPIHDTDRDDLDPRSSGVGGLLAPDVRVRLTVETEGPAEVEVSWAPGDGRAHALRMATADLGYSEVRVGKSGRRLSDSLATGRPVPLELESVDGDLRAWVDGREIAVVADEIPLDEAIRLEGLGRDGPAQRLSLAARGARVVLRDVRVDHDLYYTNYRSDAMVVPKADETLHVPSDGYFMLGDNTRHSSDSRRWTAQGVRLKDGTRILWEWQSTWRYATVDGRQMKEVTDVEGVTRRWALDDEDTIESERMPFVQRDRVIGRAWFALVFWPLEQAWHRVRFIH